MKQPFESCKIICEDKPCHSRGMCYAQMYIWENTNQKLKRMKGDDKNDN